MENWKWKVENCEYYNPKTKKCRIFREPECGIKLTSFKCEDDHDCYYKRLGKNIEENIDLKKYIEKMDKPEIKTIDAEVAMENIRLKQCLQEIREIVSEPCIPDEKCSTCKSSCMQKDILEKISEVLDEPKK